MTECKNGLYLLMAMAIMFAAHPVKAQNSMDKVNDFLLKMEQAYRRSAYLGFHVKYMYANAGSLSNHLDSLSGEVEMDKGRSRLVIDGTQTVITERYAIHVVDEDKMIYLGKPGGNNPMDPVGMLDSLLAHVKGASAYLENTGQDQVLTLSFPINQPYTRVRMTTDPVTGWLTKVEYDLHTSGLVGDEQISSPGHHARYEREGRVEIIFSQYKKGGFGDELFDESRFFTRTGNQFSPSGAYKDYQIFLASSNL